MADAAPTNTDDSAPWAQGPIALASRIVRGIRPEEWLLIALWGFGAALCLNTGTGFKFGYVFSRYLKFFASYALLMVLGSRVLFAFAESWRPSHPQLRKLRRFLFGDAEGWASIVAIDVELARGLVLLFANLAVYSNLKIRIPAINPEVGDALFLAWDHAIFGENFAPWLEQYTQDHPQVSGFLSKTYKHDYLWMVVLLWVGYMRRDIHALRWIFGATCLTYLVSILITVGYPSMGPFFMEPERFAWVNDTGVGSAQRFLRRFYSKNLPILEAGTPMPGKAFAGIAAFPSLHIGHMVVMGWISLRLVPVYAVWMVLVTTVTFFATVAFGWHYAVDAIGGVIVAILCTELVFQILKRDPARSRAWVRNSLSAPPTETSE